MRRFKGNGQCRPREGSMVPIRASYSFDSSDLKKGGAGRNLSMQQSRKGSIWSRYFNRDSGAEYESLTWKCEGDTDSTRSYRTQSATTSMITMDSQATTIISVEVDKALPNLDLGEFFVGKEADQKFAEIIRTEKERYAKMRGIP